MVNKRQIKTPVAAAATAKVKTEPTADNDKENQQPERQSRYPKRKMNIKNEPAEEEETHHRPALKQTASNFFMVIDRT
jgi:hypothetical protein